MLGPKIDFEIDKVSSLDFEVPTEDKNILGLKVGIGTEVNLFALNLLAEILYDADFTALYETANLRIDSNSYDLRVGIMF
jgi:hypothetical protein